MKQSIVEFENETVYRITKGAITENDSFGHDGAA